MNSGTLTAALTGFGGLALFLFGMSLLSKGLQAASGHRFGSMMQSIARRRFRGFLLGLTMGSAVQSSAATVMTVGILNAGLVTLAGAVPIIAGANLGTTVSMQLVAFDKSWLWAGFAVIGSILIATGTGTARARVGQAFIGLALLFLGMALMGQAVFPFRDVLSGWIARHNGADWPAFLLSFAGAAFFTALIQSSGAAIGILFALANAGILTSLHQAFPLILGAQIGTCITALLSAAGTSAEARRGAIAHLLFNVLTAAVSIALMHQIIRLAAFPGSSMIRQIANVHSISMGAGCLLVIPALGLFIRLLRALTPFRKSSQEQSFLDDTLLERPEEALLAVRNELGRITRIIRRGFYLNRELLKQNDRKVYQHAKRCEMDVDQIYHATRRYLLLIAHSLPDGERAGRAQWMNLCLTNLERISDHNDNLADLILDIHHRLDENDAAFARSIGESLFNQAEPVLNDIQQAWHDMDEKGREQAATIKQHRADYMTESEKQASRIVDKITDGGIKPVTGFIMTEFINETDRLVRHAKRIGSALKKNTPVPEKTKAEP